jgi:hypothetical protein
LRLAHKGLAGGRARRKHGQPEEDASFPMSAPAGRLAAVVFDANGTLLDVHAAVTRHAACLGPQVSAGSVLCPPRLLPA